MFRLKKMFGRSEAAAVLSSRQPKTTPITSDYEISNTVLGLGINGKVVQCLNRRNGRKYALKVRHFFFDFISLILIPIV